ncbi:MAG: UPF0149 family protein [Pseudomonadota bacterium]
MPTTDTPAPEPLAPEDFDALDDILDELRTRDDEIPQWEFCDGFMAALVCCRRAIPQEEYLSVLLGDGATPDDAGAPMAGSGVFSGVIQQRRFLELWQRRWDDIVASLDAKVESLDDERSYQPEIMDVRGTIAALPEEERPEIADEDMPSIAQVWALGFMYAVENWEEDWAAPRDKDAAQWLDDALATLVALTEPDAGKPEIPMFSEDGPPSVSEQRLNDYGEAIWAVYDLRQLWRSLGPKVETLRKAAEPGRNDPCPCGSGKKYKKCHGAG